MQLAGIRNNTGSPFSFASSVFTDFADIQFVIVSTLYDIVCKFSIGETENVIKNYENSTKML